MPQKYLLSIDGGGIRGIIPLCALVKLEETLQRPARELFSFVAGTSTGAIITAGIAAGVSAQQMLDLYLHRSNEVFPQRPWNIVKRIVSGSMYSTETLQRVIAEEAGPAGAWALNDAPIDVLITAKGLSDGWPWYFVRDNPKNSGRTGRLALAACAAASAAAPTYFNPLTIAEDAPPAGQQEWRPLGALIDGGVGVTGNPVYQACVEAFHYSDQYVPEETTVISLGTGHSRELERPGWIWSWLQWILAELLRSPGEQQTELVHRHFPQVAFYRLDPELERDIPMDDIGNVSLLHEVGRAFAAQINWQGILDGADPTFLVTPQKKRAAQYMLSLKR